MSPASSIECEMSEKSDSQSCLIKMTENPTTGNQMNTLAPTTPASVHFHTQTQLPPALMMIQLGDTPMRMICPNCRIEVTTRTREETSLFQRLACLLLCLNGLFCCCCIPYCCSSCANTRHECPVCSSHLGSSGI